MTRTLTDSERSFWAAVDSGERIRPPVPCRACGMVWEHSRDCETQLSPVERDILARYIQFTADKSQQGIAALRKHCSHLGISLDALIRAGS